MNDELEEIDIEIQRLKKTVIKMDTMKKDLQNLMLLSGSKDFEDRLLQLKNTYTTEKEQSFIYEFFLNDMKETHQSIKKVSERLNAIKIAEAV